MEMIILRIYHKDSHKVRVLYGNIFRKINFQIPEGGLLINQATGRLTNFKLEYCGFFQNLFHGEWRAKFETMIYDEEKDSIDSEVGNRHQIVHNYTVGVSYVR